ncbi:hypothetical protein [Clostridium sp. DMHC 10]|nr:hypothetical protein [Clostridium sp. DMHC 10]
MMEPTLIPGSREDSFLTLIPGSREDSFLGSKRLKYSAQRS